MIWCTCLKMAYDSKTVSWRAMQSERLDSGTLVKHNGVIFYLVVWKVILQSFGAPFPKMASDWLTVSLRMKQPTWGK